MTPLIPTALLNVFPTFSTNALIGVPAPCAIIAVIAAAAFGVGAPLPALPKAVVEGDSKASPHSSSESLWRLPAWGRRRRDERARRAEGVEGA